MLGDILTLLLSIGLPILIILWFLRKQSGGAGGGGVFGFGKSTAKLFVKGKQTLTFKDVAARLAIPLSAGISIRRQPPSPSSAIIHCPKKRILI